MHVEMWPIDRPIPYARNARKISQAAIDKVAASIQEFGWRQPIVVDENDVIIVGHCRLLGAKKLGLDEVPVHVATDLTPEQVKAYRLMDNRANQETAWDVGLLSLELAELKDFDLDLALTGFDTKEIDSYLKTVEHTIATMNGEAVGEEDLLDPTAEADQNAHAEDPDHAVKLSWGRNKVSLTPDESIRLEELLKSYTMNSGLAYGFATWLIEGGAKELAEAQS